MRFFFAMPQVSTADLTAAAFSNMDHYECTPPSPIRSPDLFCVSGTFL